jgi:hypothetical protein
MTCGRYESKFGNWDNRAAVRTRPRRLLGDDDGEALLFPPEFVPAIAHPVVVDRGPGVMHRILLHSLYQYLHFTTVLEQVVVLPITSSLAVGRSGLDVPEGMRADAFKITTDEAWHAQFSYDFIQQLATATGIDPSAITPPSFLRRLEEIRATFDPGSRHLVDLLFTVVSETLVSSLLSEIPNDTRLPVPVRDLVADHAVDEGRHHAYFRSFLRWLWPHLSNWERQRITPRVPDLIHVFLDPDAQAVSAALKATGFSQEEAAAIVSESYASGAPIFDVEPAARATVRGFQEVGALDDPATHDAFLTAGLLVDHA